MSRRFPAKLTLALIDDAMSLIRLSLILARSGHRLFDRITPFIRAGRRFAPNIALLISARPSPFYDAAPRLNAEFGENVSRTLMYR